MQKSEIAQRLAATNETETKNTSMEIRFTADLENLTQQKVELTEILKTQFKVSSLDELRTLWRTASQEDERAVTERETLVLQRKEKLEAVQSAVQRVNAGANRG